LVLLAAYHSTSVASASNLIFAPYVETAGKLGDSMSVSLHSASAESSEDNLTRYCCTMRVLNGGLTIMQLCHGMGF